MNKLSFILIFTLLTACQAKMKNDQVTASGVNASNRTITKVFDDWAASISKS